VIVLDLMMPDMSGFDVVALLHGQPETARIPTLVVTARQVNAEERSQAERLRNGDHGEGRVQPRPAHP
jgi:CheY-like chemotaxis protein